MTTPTTVHLSVTNTKTGQVTLNETFHLAAGLTGDLIEQLEEMIARLPPKRMRVARTQVNGATLIDLEVLPDSGSGRRPARAGPTFEDRYRHKKEAADETA